MNVLITGLEGFVGSYLAEYILSTEETATLHGTVRPHGSLENVKHILDRIQTHEVDITDEPSLFSLIDSIRPDIVYHLAAQSYVRTSWESPQATLTTNVLGCVNVLESLRQLKTELYDPVVIIPGSSEEYGHPSGSDFITEEFPLQPLSPYAVSKISQDFLGFQYWQTYRLRAIRLRIFNHTGPRRPTAFGDSHLAHTIALIENDNALPEVTYRDLTAIRDFTDVRDIARAYVLAARHCIPGEVYNVCSSHGVSINDMYTALLSLAAKKPIQMKQDPAGPRPTDGGVVIGDNRKFRQATGWAPRISFLEQTLPDMLGYWRDLVSLQTRHEAIRAHSRI